MWVLGYVKQVNFLFLFLAGINLFFSLEYVNNHKMKIKLFLNDFP